MKNNINSKNIAYFLLIFLSFVLILGQSQPVFASSKLEMIQTKIKELKHKEKVEIKKLTNTQKTLEKTQDTIKTYEHKLVKSKENMSRLENKLDYLNNEYQSLSTSSYKRIREIYKGEKITNLDLLFNSKDINSLFDRIYYQKRVIKRDRELMAHLRQKSVEIKRNRRNIEYEKQAISSSIASMNEKKKNLSSSIQTSEYLIEKLRTDRVAYEQAQKELESISRAIEKNFSKTVSKEKVNSDFLRPIVGSITSPYGWRRHPIFNTTRFHSGVDISGPNRTPIKASNSGQVIFSGWYGGYGKVVIISHGTLKNGAYSGRGVSTLYAHMSSIAVSTGSTVQKGSIVGYEGSTGYSTGPHLHFEVRIDGKPTNPLSFIGY